RTYFAHALTAMAPSAVRGAGTAAPRFRPAVTPEAARRRSGLASSAGVASSFSGSGSPSASAASASASSSSAASLAPSPSSGADSPGLWPTIGSETKTGTCLRPSWTAMVWPTISGKIVDARDQVLIICLSPEVFITSMRRSRRSSAHGPFLDERDMALALPLAATAPPHDEAVGRLALLARRVTERRHAPRRDRVAPRRGGPLPAAVRMVHRVHRGSPGL